MSTTRVLEEFAADNVVYVEVRTTPRAIPGRMRQVDHITKVLGMLITTVSTAVKQQAPKHEDTFTIHSHFIPGFGGD